MTKSCDNCGGKNNNSVMGCQECVNHSNWKLKALKDQKLDTQTLKQSSNKPMVGLLLIDFKDALSEIIKSLQYNATHKYHPQSWMKMYNFVPERELIEAIYRHLDAHNRDELIDPEDNCSHLAHIVINTLFLLTFQIWRRKKL
jgi:hypothetical protein